MAADCVTSTPWGGSYRKYEETSVRTEGGAVTGFACGQRGNLRSSAGVSSKQSRVHRCGRIRSILLILVVPLVLVAHPHTHTDGSCLSTGDTTPVLLLVSCGVGVHLDEGRNYRLQFSKA